MKRLYPRTNYNKSCRLCKDVFETTSTNKLYCSVQCRDEFREQEFSKAKKQCTKCTVEFIPKNNTQRFCGAKCRQAWSREVREPNTKCGTCEKLFYLAECYKGERNYCSVSCRCKGHSDWHEACRVESGKPILNNSYYVYAPLEFREKYQTEHVMNVCLRLGVEKIDSEFCVHHRDTIRSNNSLGNLVVLYKKDHTWLHGEYGSGTLWGFMKGDVSLELMISWSKNPERARRLLTSCVLDQTADTVFLKPRTERASGGRLLVVEKFERTKRILDPAKTHRENRRARIWPDPDKNSISS